MNALLRFILDADLSDNNVFAQIYNYWPFNRRQDARYPGNVFQYVIDKLHDMTLTDQNHDTTIQIKLCLRKLILIMPNYINAFTAKDASITLYKLIKLKRILQVDADIFRSISQSLLNQFLLFKHESNAHNLAQTLWAAIKIETLTISSDDVRDMISLIHQQCEQLCPQDISISLWSCAKLIEARTVNISNPLTAVQIRTLILQFHNVLPLAIAQNISNLLWAVAVFINTNTFNNIAFEDLEPLVHRFNNDSRSNINNVKTVQSIADSLWAYTIFLQKFNRQPNIAVYDKLLAYANDYLNASHRHLLYGREMHRQLSTAFDFLTTARRNVTRRNVAKAAISSPPPTIMQNSSAAPNPTSTQHTSPLQQNLISTIIRYNSPLSELMPYLYTCQPFARDATSQNPSNVLSFVMIALANVSNQSEFPNFSNISEYHNYVLLKILPLIHANIDLLDAKSISTILHRMAKLQIHNEHLDLTNIVSQLLAKMVARLSDVSLILDSQSLANSLWAIAKLLDIKKIQVIDNNQITQLVEAFCVAQSKAEEVTGVLWAMPVFIKYNAYPVNTEMINRLIYILNINATSAAASFSCVVMSMHSLLQYMENAGAGINLPNAHFHTPNIQILIAKFNDFCDTTNDLRLCIVGLRALAVSCAFLPQTNNNHSLTLIGLNKVMTKVMAALPAAITTDMQLNLVEALGMINYGGTYPLQELVDHCRPRSRIGQDQLRRYQYTAVEFSAYVRGFFVDALLTMHDGSHIALVMATPERTANGFRDRFLDSLGYKIEYCVTHATLSRQQREDAPPRYQSPPQRLQFFQGSMGSDPIDPRANLHGVNMV